MKHRFGTMVAGIVAAASLAGFVAGAQAQQDPLAVVEARKTELKKAGDAMKAAAGFVRDGRGTAADVQAAAATIDAVAKAFPGWWPEGTAAGLGKSEAKPGIWTNPDDFKAKTTAFQTEAAAFVVAAAGGDKAAIGDQVGKLGGSCKACHDAYRE
ncbi:c-type cytochrome [Niveispirillum fermenti]|uniref:c-type cytochrome n=1 Tax=Niveispirillum fermenti TaxID=1233113 RepID=UPI003A8B1585